MKDTPPHLQALEEVERQGIPGLLEVLREEGVDGVRYVDRFLAAQEEARAAGRGLWGLSPEELAAQTDRDNGIGGGGCPGEEQAAEPTPQPQPRPQPRPQPQPKAPPPRPAPQPAPQPAPAAPQGGDVDCSDFSSSAEAQPYLLPGDPNRLDADGDGQACDSLG